jgi:excisionase family DNA binding protein
VHEKSLFGLRESGEALGVSRSLIRKLVRTGKLQSVRINRRVLIPAAEVQRLATKGTGNAGTQVAAHV